MSDIGDMMTGHTRGWKSTTCKSMNKILENNSIGKKEKTKMKEILQLKEQHRKVSNVFL